MVADGYEGSETEAAGATVPLKLDGGLILSLYPRSELAKDARIPPSLPASGEFGELPRGGRAAEVRAMLAPFAASDDVELVCELASRELPEGQALHGDAHLFNCIQTATGPVWHDLETACRGPREFDLAALVLDDRSRGPDPEARAAIAAYGPYNEDILEQTLPVYASWVAASFMVAIARRPDAAPALERQLRFLRRFRS